MEQRTAILRVFLGLWNSFQSSVANTSFKEAIGRTLVLSHLLCLFNVISVITTSPNHARLVNFNASLLESPFALMKACC